MREPTARHTDPESSHAAAEEVKEAAATQCEKVLEALRKYPNSTSMELAHYMRADRYMVARRLADLAAVKPGRPALVEKRGMSVCSINKRKSVRWAPCH